MFCLNKLISIITTIDFCQRSSELFQRLKIMYEVTSKYDIELVIGHNDRKTSHDEKLKKWHKNVDKNKCSLVSVEYEDDVNNSYLRNVALDIASNETIILMDVDIYPDINIINYLKEKIDSGCEMAMLPCIYLTDVGTKIFLKKKNFNEIINDFFLFKRKYVLHVAAPSSVIAFEMDLVRKVGKFDEKYSGHGYEDFDFITRLGLECKKIRLNRELIVDRTYTAPLLAEGFRKHLAKICVSEMVEKKFAFHLYHSRGDRDNYISSREANRSIFLKKINNLINENIICEKDFPDDLILNFFKICHDKNVDVKNYYAYFDARPSYIIYRYKFHGVSRRFFKYVRSFLKDRKWIN